MLLTTQLTNRPCTKLDGQISNKARQKKSKARPSRILQASRPVLTKWNLVQSTLSRSQCKPDAQERLENKSVANAHLASIRSRMSHACLSLPRKGWWWNQLELAMFSLPWCGRLKARWPLYQSNCRALSSRHSSMGSRLASIRERPLKTGHFLTQLSPYLKRVNQDHHRDHRTKVRVQNNL